MRRLLKMTLLLLVCGAAVFVIGVWFFLFDAYIHPVRMLVEGNPLDYGLDYQNHIFTTRDGLELKAWLILPPPSLRTGRLPTIFAVHGYSTSRWDIIERCALLARAGFLVIAYDQRASGESEGTAVTGGPLETADLRSVIDQAVTLPEVDPERLGVYGFSMGATVAIIAAAGDERIDAVVADSPYASLREISAKVLRDRGLPEWPFVDLMNLSFQWSFGVDMASCDATAVAARIAPRPLLILAGEKDQVVPHDHPQRIFSAAREPRRLAISPGGGHFDNGTPVLFGNTIVPFFWEVLKK
jgi:dipeptidyl aminopeptidase/acylaminoacyl peptidase